MAVTLLLTIAAVLAWGTLYETRFGTAAVQRFIYQSWWFETLLGFLAVNLGVAALQRFPWKRKHIPFVSAHIGIILILIGGIVGGRFGIEGQLIIPEGETSSTLQLSHKVLVVSQPNPGIEREFPTHFEATAWVHRPHAFFQVPLADRTLDLVVDRYYPNALSREEVIDEGGEENPAIHLAVSHEGQEEGIWLFAKDPDRFGARWGEAHILYLEPQTPLERRLLMGGNISFKERGAVRIGFPDLGVEREIPVPKNLNKKQPIPGTPYAITFKKYFADFSFTQKGVASRSNQPNNPAVAFTLTGPEGTDAHILFALHPEFPSIHGRQQRIHVHLSYAHPAGGSLPPNTIGLLRDSASGQLESVLTGSAGERHRIDSVVVGKEYEHPWLKYRFMVTANVPRASILRHFENRSDEIKAEVVHVSLRDGNAVTEGWVPLRERLTVPLGGHHPVVVEYRPALTELPFSLKLIDFRKIDYPGISMAAGFESDVELSDPEKGLTLKRTIRMNTPLKYRGFTLFQSSYVQGPTETTVLSVRKDPGTPFVYAGFLIVLLGVISMFVLHRNSSPVQAGATLE